MDRWVFTDNVAPETYTVDVNPNEGGTPPIERSFTYSSTPGPGGPSIAFEGRDRPRKFSISGCILMESHLVAFQNWFTKEYQVKITDDLNREFWIYITDLEFERNQTRRYPWRHTFRMGYIELDWP